MGIQALGFFIIEFIFSVQRWKSGGGDVPKLEPIKRFNFRSVDKIVRDLRRIYKENPTLFDIPAFAQKQY
ncbi:MAG: hypothetical protein A2W41_04535 [Candidatus Ryanbacteria bacterium RIFCSPHIGHO2_01_45_13]|uniref:Uncharacterized protein n=1 Tax=Candidatus Ryanbacteria bacterium RIFCSPHIGHO2_01_45_13 TaxID=1802112 RepID=A0A1G2FTR0_9BACT|nr:MAG: hypothetical protein A2W41_04535 [Candidatus Ryanbacteria bacterium RIFCSPHIGHO2_01_45_13]